LNQYRRVTDEVLEGLQSTGCKIGSKGYKFLIVSSQRSKHSKNALRHHLKDRRMDVDMSAEGKELKKKERIRGGGGESEVTTTCNIKGGVGIETEANNCALRGRIKPVLDVLVLAVEATGSELFVMNHTDKAVALLGETFVALATKDLGEKESARIITVEDTKEGAGVARKTSFLVLAFDGLLRATVAFSVYYAALNKAFDAGFVHGQRMRRDVAQAAIIGDANRIVTRRNGGNEEAARDTTRRLRRRRRRFGDFVKE